MTHLYVLSGRHADPQNYIIGTTTHSEEYLVRSYSRYLLEPVINLFIPCSDPVRVESFLKLVLDKYRLGWVWDPLEQVRCDFHTIEKAIDRINLVTNHKSVGYHNFYELNITDSDILCSAQ